MPEAELASEHRLDYCPWEQWDKGFDLVSYEKLLTLLIRTEGPTGSAHLAVLRLEHVPREDRFDLAICEG